MRTAFGCRKTPEAEPITLPARYEALRQILRITATHRDTDTLFKASVEALRSFFGLPMVGIVLYDTVIGSVQWCALDVEDRPLPFTPMVDWERSASRFVYESQQALVVNCLDGKFPFRNLTQFVARFGMQSVCLLPLTTTRRKLGIMGFASEYRGYFSSEIVEFLSLVADELALGLHSALNYGGLEVVRNRYEEQATRLKLLFEVDRVIDSHLELSKLMQVLSPYFRRFIPVDAVALILPKAQDSRLYIHALEFPTAPSPVRNLETIQVHQRESIAARVFRSGRPWVGKVANFDEYRRMDPALAASIRAVCALPIARYGNVLGVLGFGRTEEREFSPEDTEFLLHVASRLAVAVADALKSGERTRLGEAGFPGPKLIGGESSHPATSDARPAISEEIIGNSSALRNVLKQVELVAPTSTSVLICGETGTGKEMLARAVHASSGRNGGPFIKVNCAALPAGLLESELFGHEKGAFTGATSQRLGRFELAHGGTIFLDEIGELPLELQPKLLRVLQDGEFERVGSSRTFRTNARLIAATNRDLAVMVEQGRFREDLFYRLDVFPMNLPPLRERPEDIPLLVEHFLKRFANRMGKAIDRIDPDTMRVLLEHSWPGNIRELENVVERGVILSSGPALRISLSAVERSRLHRDSQGSQSSARTLIEVERTHILSTLERTNWVLGGPFGAAARLGMKRSTLQLRMQKLGITRPGKPKTDDDTRLPES
jgi:formate hydrogenlyase transcriptional activator